MRLWQTPPRRVRDLAAAGLFAGVAAFGVLGLVGCGDDDGAGNQNTVAYYEPYDVRPTDDMASPGGRDWVVRRVIVHSHSPYSHDACDGNPRPDGERNEPCFQDVRRGMCETRQDAVFLTDHDDLFAHFEYPEVLLYAPGDTLVERDGQPVANRVDCGDGHSVLVAAGTESAMMPIGLEHHVGETLEARMAAYNTVDATAIRALQAAGALVFLQHTEEWAPEQVDGLPIDGIEVYNVHFNVMDNLATVLQLAIELATEPETMPVPELGLLAVFQENEVDLTHWARASRFRRLPGVLATDAHQNVIDEPMSDGDRLDSFRRTMRWFANYVLVPPGPADDRTYKEAIAAGRLYGTFDYLGYPVGFDFHATTDASVVEMGGQVVLGAPGVGSTVTLHVSCPTVWRLDPRGPQPDITCRILEAQPDGTWREVDAAEGDLTVPVGEGVYRAEVRIFPRHLVPWLGPDPDRFLAERVWIYANPIYVRVP